MANACASVIGEVIGGMVWPISDLASKKQRRGSLMTPSTTPSFASQSATAMALAAVYALAKAVLAPPAFVELAAVPPGQSAGSRSARTTGNQIDPGMNRFQLKA